MSETELMHQIQLKASNLGHRLWRNNIGVAWVGQQVRMSRPGLVMMREGDILLRSARAVRYGLAPGSSDLIGLTSSGQFLACEVKAPAGRPTDRQESFIDMVNRLGGRGFIAKTLEDFNV